MWDESTALKQLPWAWWAKRWPPLLYDWNGVNCVGRKCTEIWLAIMFTHNHALNHSSFEQTHCVPSQPCPNKDIITFNFQENVTDYTAYFPSTPGTDHPLNLENCGLGIWRQGIGALDSSQVFMLTIHKTRYSHINKRPSTSKAFMKYFPPDGGMDQLE